MEKVHRRAVKLAPTLVHVPYEERMTRLRLTNLDEGRHRGDMIEVFEVL